MEWTEEYESGLPDIDEQHRQIFMLIHRIGEVDVSNDRVGARAAIVELERVGRYHFDNEERLMVESDYPDAMKHKAEHAKLLRELKGYRDNTVFSASQLSLVLCNWLMSHTLMDDRPLAVHIQKNYINKSRDNE